MFTSQFIDKCKSVAEDVKRLEDFTTHDVIPNSDLLALIRHFNEVSKCYDALDDAKKRLNKIYDQLSIHTVPDKMREAGVKTINVEDVGRVTVSYRYSASMLDKEKGFEWLRNNGLGGIITETVNSSTLSATAKNLLVDEGKELPADVFKTSTSPYTSITRK